MQCVEEILYEICDVFSNFGRLYDVNENIRQDKMKAKVRHLFDMISGAILSLLGFTSCAGLGPVEYGMPHANFKVMGDVKAAENGKPIEGIVVKFSRESENDRIWETAEFKSDKDGKVDGSTQAWPSEEGIILTFEDVDGEENGGLYAPDTLRAKDLQINFVEDKKSTWHKGDYDITFHSKLKKADKQ